MKPILFNTEMVKAILEGRKTVTRRVIKNMTDCIFLGLDIDPIMCLDNDIEKVKKVKGLWATFDAYDWPVDYPMVKAPYQPGDILYIR
ncbi:hypothetical protein F1904_13115, partial [Akkermansia muciniphila]